MRVLKMTVGAPSMAPHPTSSHNDRLAAARVGDHRPPIAIVDREIAEREIAAPEFAAPEIVAREMPAPETAVRGIGNAAVAATFVAVTSAAARFGVATFVVAVTVRGVRQSPRSSIASNASSISYCGCSAAAAVASALKASNSVSAVVVAFPVAVGVGSAAEDSAVVMPQTSARADSDRRISNKDLLCAVKTHGAVQVVAPQAAVTLVAAVKIVAAATHAAVFRAAPVAVTRLAVRTVAMGAATVAMATKDRPGRNQEPSLLTRNVTKGDISFALTYVSG
jgi:hypothetical protein